MEAAEESLARFDPAEFVLSCRKYLRSVVRKNTKNGIVFGASGGIDSLVTAALCARAKDGMEWPVAGLQMTDSRIRGENYHPGAYRNLGVELIQEDITGEAVQQKKDFHLPSRRVTLFFMKLVLRQLPVRVRRWLILQVKSGSAPRWAMNHLELLTLHHRIRIARLKAFAVERGLVVVICANRTEAMLGYFVEQGVDDTRMGDAAPIAGLYKTQVIAVARYLGLPAEIIAQRPSPGFGGIYDEEILGPYELVDPILAGFDLGYSNEKIARWAASGSHGPGPPEAARYVRFLRAFSRCAAQK